MTRLSVRAHMLRSVQTLRGGSARRMLHYMADQDLVLKDSFNGVRRLVLNRPKALNALNHEMVKDLSTSLHTYQRSPVARVVVLEGAGERAFCAGGDIASLRSNAVSGRIDDACAFFKDEYQLNYDMATSGLPIVSVIDGIVMGGGVGVSVHNAIRVATERSHFAMPETKIGFFPDVGGTFFLPRMDGFLGTYLGLTGNSLRGDEVMMSGIATHYIPADRLDHAIERLGSLEFRSATSAASLLNDFTEHIPQDRWNSWKYAGPIRRAINATFNRDSVPEIVRALEELASSAEEDVKAWARKTLEALHQRSPLALHATLMALRRGRNSSLSGALEYEYQLSRFMIQQPDFQNGVQGVLTKSPATWSSKLEDPFNVRDLEAAVAKMPRIQIQRPAGTGEIRRSPHEGRTQLPRDEDIMAISTMLGVSPEKPQPVADLEGAIYRTFSERLRSLMSGTARPYLSEKIHSTVALYGVRNEAGDLVGWDL